MIQLLQPIWLYAIAGIAIPFIIHLWDVRGGKKLLVGSISLVEESARQQGRSLRLTDILLLMLRCLLIILLALVLAEPTWKKQLSATTEKGWVMIQKQSVRTAYTHFKPAIDSLLKAGYSFHYYNKGFQKINFADAISQADTISPDRDLYWSLLKELNQQVPAEFPVYLYSDDQLQKFEGARPEISMNLTWNTFNSKDSLRKVPAFAFRTASDSIRMVTAHSNPSAIFYTYENIAPTGNDQYKLVNNKIKIAKPDLEISEIDLDTTVMQINIYTDQFFTDANYLKLAIEAIQQYTQKRITVKLVRNLAEIENGASWLFWLSEKPLSLQQNIPNIFVYGKGKEQLIRSWIRRPDAFAINQQPVKISRRIQVADAAQENTEAIWKDGFGNTLLSREVSNASTYHFYSRFNPDWNELPWNPQFVEMLFNLIVDQDSFLQKEWDKRVIDAAQLQPLIAIQKKGFDKEKFVEKTDLSKIFWLAAFVIFCMERFLSLKSNHKNLHV